MRIAVSVNFQFSLFSGGVQGCALSVAETLKAMGHEITLLNRGSANDWWDDVHNLKNLWPNRVQWDSAVSQNIKYDLLVELSWFCTPEERVKIAKKAVWFSRKPALITDMELSTYMCSMQKRNLDGIAEVWTWEWISLSDLTYIECLTGGIPIKKLPYVWTPTIVEVHMRSVGYPYWSEIVDRPADAAWRIHVAETNNTNSSSTVLPLVIMRELKRRNEFPIESWRIHNADNIKNCEFFKDNILEHSKISDLSGEFLGRQRCIDWAVEGTSCLLSHIRFLPFRPMHFDCMWSGYPMIHNSLFLKQLGCGWERLCYLDNSITGACQAFENMQSDFKNKAGIFSKNSRETVRNCLMQTISPDAVKKSWASILNLDAVPGLGPALSSTPSSMPAEVPVVPVTLQYSNTIKSLAPQKKFRIAFTDMWDDFNPAYNFFTLLLEEASKHLAKPYQIEVVTESPDLLVFGPFGEQWKTFENVTKVHFTGENTEPVKDSSVKLNLGFKHVDFSDDSYMRLPLWMIEIDWFNADADRIQNPKPIPLERVVNVYPDEISKKTKFCSFIVTNPKNSVRNQAFLALNSYKKVDSAGRLFNNVGNEIFAGRGGGGGEIKKLEFLKNYRFSITYENASEMGYTTEKLLHAKAAGCIPIYWGDPVVERDFDPAGFIDARGCRDTDELVELVRRIDENQEEWMKRFNVPALDSYKKDLVRRNLSELARRLILLGLKTDCANELPRFLGRDCVKSTAVATVKPVSNILHTAPSQSADNPLVVTAANFKFLPSLNHWLNCLNKTIAARVYLWSDITNETLATLQKTNPYVEFLRFPEDFQPFPDYWDPSHYAWKIWIYHSLTVDPAMKGRCILYLDSGGMLIKWPTEMFDIALEKGVCFLEDNTQFNEQWCHASCIQQMNITQSELASMQIVAGISVFQAGSPLATRIFTEAFKWSQNRYVISGAKWEGIRNGKPYGHRHDQSILSVLSARANAPRLPLYDYYSHESLRVASVTGKCFYIHRGNFIENKPFLPKIDDAFVINMEHRKDRVEKLLLNNPELKGRLSKLKACNGRDLTLTPSIARLFKPNDFLWKKSILGCALSHLSIWNRLVNDGVNTYLIMEDDVKFQRGWQERWYSAISDNAVPDDFDVIYLGGILPPNKQGFESVKEKYNKHFSRVVNNQFFGQQTPTRYFHFCNYSYILSKKGAQKILNTIKERDGYWTSADHMVCNRVDGPNAMINYFLDPLVAGCYQDDDPKYAQSQFNNFNRVDEFDSDLWNNDERFSQEEVLNCFKENPALDINKALLDAFLKPADAAAAAILIEKEAKKLYAEQLKVASQQLPPLPAPVLPPAPASAPAYERIYSIPEHGINQENMWESGWLGFLLGKKHFQITHCDTLLDNSPIFLYQKPHCEKYAALAQKYANANKPFSIIHLSDEFCNDPIDIYRNPSCKNVIRFYNRANLPANVKVIPLGFHWGPTRNHHPANPLINSPSLPFRETIWSFHGTRWTQRDKKLESLTAVTPNKYTLYDSWESKKLGEKEYMARLLDSVFVPCPSGNNSETFRLYEALDAGAIPILSKEDMNPEFLQSITKHLPLVVLNKWVEAPAMIQEFIGNKDFMEKYRNQLMSAWFNWKLQLQMDVKGMMG